MPGWTERHRRGVRSRVQQMMETTRTTSSATNQIEEKMRKKPRWSNRSTIAGPNRIPRIWLPSQRVCMSASSRAYATGSRSVDDGNWRTREPMSPETTMVMMRVTANRTLVSVAQAARPARATRSNGAAGRVPVTAVVAMRDPGCGRWSDRERGGHRPDARRRLPPGPRRRPPAGPRCPRDRPTRAPSPARSRRRPAGHRRAGGGCWTADAPRASGCCPGMRSAAGWSGRR